MTGSRFTMTVQGNQGVATNDATAGIDPNYVAANLWQTANFNVGGTDTTYANSRGHVFGSNPQTVLTSGATNYNHAAGEEINVNITNNVALRSGLTVASVSGAGKGQVVDAAMWTYGAGAKWTDGWLLGGPTSVWPFDTGSSIISATTSAASVPQQANWGVDFNEVSFTATGNVYDGGFLRSNGFSVDGAGLTRIGTTLMTPSSTGLSVDAVGSVGTTANGAGAIAAGGTGYTNGTNTDIARDPYGGLYRLTVSGGVVTSITVLVQPVYPSHTTPSNPVATTTLGTTTNQGSGLTLNLSWNTTATTLALNPSGGPVTRSGSEIAFGVNYFYTTGQTINLPTGWHEVRFKAIGGGGGSGCGIVTASGTAASGGGTGGAAFGIDGSFLSSVTGGTQLALVVGSGGTPCTASGTTTGSTGSTPTAGGNTTLTIGSFVRTAFGGGAGSNAQQSAGSGGGGGAGVGAVGGNASGSTGGGAGTSGGVVGGTGAVGGAGAFLWGSTSGNGTANAGAGNAVNGLGPGVGGSGAGLATTPAAQAGGNGGRAGPTNTVQAAGGLATCTGTSQNGAAGSSVSLTNNGGTDLTGVGGGGGASCIGGQAGGNGGNSSGYGTSGGGGGSSLNGVIAGSGGTSGSGAVLIEVL